MKEIRLEDPVSTLLKTSGSGLVRTDIGLFEVTVTKLTREEAINAAMPDIFVSGVKLTRRIKGATADYMICDDDGPIKGFSVPVLGSIRIKAVRSPFDMPGYRVIVEARDFTGKKPSSTIFRSGEFVYGAADAAEAIQLTRDMKLMKGLLSRARRQLRKHGVISHRPTGVVPCSY